MTVWPLSALKDFRNPFFRIRKLIPVFIKLILFWQLMLLQTILYGQQVEELNFKLFNEQDGLSTSDVTGMAQDSLGYIWISTYNGLNRYDGYSFTVYKHQHGNNSTIADNSIIKMTTDHYGVIWLLHNNGMLSSFDPYTNKVVNYTTPFKSIAEEGAVLFVDRTNGIWITKRNGNIYSLDVKKRKWFYQKQLTKALPALSVNDLYEDDKGLLWITTPDGLYKYDRANGTCIKQNKSNPDFEPWQNYFFGQILPDHKDGLLLTSYAGGIYHFNTITKQWHNFLFESKVSGTTNIVNKIAWKNDHELWVLTNGNGFGMFDIFTSQYQFVPQQKNAPGYLCRTFLKSFNDIIWISSEKGISELHPDFNVFSFIPQTVKYSRNKQFYKVKSIFKDTLSHKIYVATSFADGLHIVDEKTRNEKVINFPVAPSDEEFVIINSLYKDRDGFLWIVTRDFVYQMTMDTYTLKDVTPLRGTTSSRSPFYDRIIQTKNGDVWITSLRNGFFHYHKNTSKFEHFPASLDELKETNLRDLAEDDEGNIWFATEGRGLLVYDPIKRNFTAYQYDAKNKNSLSNDNVTGIIKTHTGDMWASTLGGLSKADKLNPGKFINLSIEDGLPSNSILSIKEGTENTLLAVSNTELISINPDSKATKVFGIADGLDIHGNYELFYLGHDGAGGYYVGTAGGYYLFNEGNIYKQPLKSPLQIDKFKVFDREIKLTFNESQTSTVNLPYDQNSISIEYVLLNFNHPEKNTYSYILEGFDTKWNHNTFHKYVSYTNLPPGNFTFRVKADNASTPSTIKIHIAPPFWQTWWFGSLAIVLAAGLVYGTYYYRVKHIIEREELRTIYNKKVVEAEMTALRAQMNPHFIFNCLNSINSYIIKSDVATASKYLTKFAKLIRLILKNSEDKMVPLENELSALKLYIELEGLRFMNKFDYAIDVDSNVNVLSIYIPPLIIQPFVENAIWHGLLHSTTPGYIVVKIFLKENELICIIEDNGIGRKKAHELKSKMLSKEKSFGMKITSDRLNILDQSGSPKSFIEVIDLTDPSGKGIGTRVILKVPHKN